MTSTFELPACNCEACQSPRRDQTLRTVATVTANAFLTIADALAACRPEACPWSFATTVATVYADYIGVALAAQARHAPERDAQATLRALVTRIIAAYDAALERAL